MSSVAGEGEGLEGLEGLDGLDGWDGWDGLEGWDCLEGMQPISNFYEKVEWSGLVVYGFCGFCGL